MLYFLKKSLNKSTSLLLALGLFFAMTSLVEAASLEISPSSGTYGVGQTFTATIQVLPDGEDVSAVEATLRFNPSIMSVVSLSKNDSPISLWTAEPTFSNTSGVIEFGGVSPAPMTGPTELLSITFETLLEGTGEITFTNVSVLAPNGRETDATENSDSAPFTVIANTAKPDEVTLPADVEGPPQVVSEIFVDPELWYRETEGRFTWALPRDVTAVAVEITDDPDSDPEQNEEAIYEPPISEFTVSPEIIQDGIQYVSVSFQTEEGWGATTNRKLQIDTTEPEPFNISVLPGVSSSSFPLLRFEAQDETSGVDYYDMIIGDSRPVKVPSYEARIGYPLAGLEDGIYEVRILAVDKAGNVRESTSTVPVSSGWIEPIIVKEVAISSNQTNPNALLIPALIIIVLLQLAYYGYARRKQKQKEELLMKETREIREQMQKIFSALRDEIFDQINSITRRKKLSAKELEAVEGLTQALEVSETLIEKEIEDVKEILK